MISNFFSRVAPPPKPSATSASPSSCSAPVTATSAATAQIAAGRIGSPTARAQNSAAPPAPPIIAPATGKARKALPKSAITAPFGAAGRFSRE